ncbi:2,3-bisphosphoglycerate-independent phosphoglycerate mutase, partial [Bacteroidota bacterium]
LMLKYPHSFLLAGGKDVGLPEGQMGNSEVGHLNIGAGRVVYQDLVRINKEVENNSIKNNENLNKAFNYAKMNNKAVHFIGLVSDGGVHSSEKHLYKLCDFAEEFGLNNIYVHAITDGRDTDPHSGAGFIQKLEDHLSGSAGKIASLVGRYYSMDRDNRWERVKIGYDLIVNGEGKKSNDIVAAIKESYDDGITDEFIKPIVRVDNNNYPIGSIMPNDVVICFNFRTDRLRELTMALTQKNMPEYEMKIMDLEYYSMTRYDNSFKGVNIIFDKENLNNTLGEVFANSGKKQIRIAETEKYPHVTFFFSGGREEKFLNEKRILIPSPKVATYDLQPEMSAFKVKDSIITELKTAETDFICLNFANGDMVGHTGIWNAIIKAVEVVDSCVGEIVEIAKENGYTTMIISDHGNADNAFNEDGTPNTAHSLNPVPCLLISDDYIKINNGVLANIAPTILKIMQMDIPVEMTAKPLV